MPECLHGETHDHVNCCILNLHVWAPVNQDIKCIAAWPTYVAISDNFMKM